MDSEGQYQTCLFFANFLLLPTIPVGYSGREQQASLENKKEA